MLRSGFPRYLWVGANLHVAQAQNSLPSHLLLNPETRLEGRKGKLADVMELENQVSDVCHCVTYLLYYNDLSEEAFGLLIEEMRPFGIRVVAYPRRDDLKHLETCGADEGLDEGVAPGSGGAEAALAGGFAPPEVGQFCCTPTEVCVPDAPLCKNPLIRKRLVPAKAAVCAMDALVSEMDTLTVSEPPPPQM